jgi:gas vesicle protein
VRGKILLVTGLAVGYVLGAKAGRERFEQIRSSANKLWNDPRVQSKVDAVEDFAKDKAPEVAEFVSDQTKRVVSKVGKKSNSTASGTGSTGTGSTSTGTSSSTAGSSTSASTGSTSPSSGGSSSS